MARVRVGWLSGWGVFTKNRPYVWQKFREAPWYIYMGRWCALFFFYLLFLSFFLLLLDWANKISSYILPSINADEHTHIHACVCVCRNQESMLTARLDWSLWYTDARISDTDSNLWSDTTDMIIEMITTVPSIKNDSDKILNRYISCVCSCRYMYFSIMKTLDELKLYWSAR